MGGLSIFGMVRSHGLRSTSRPTLITEKGPTDVTRVTQEEKMAMSQEHGGMETGPLLGPLCTLETFRGSVISGSAGASNMHPTNGLSGLAP